MISMLKQLRSIAFGLLALFFSAGMILSSCTGQTGNADGAETEAVDEAAGEEHPTEESTDEHPSEESSEHPSDTTAAEGEHPSDGE